MPGQAELIGTTADGKRQLIRLVCAIVPESFAQTSSEGADGDESATQLWLHIMPGGPLVVARDGRAFQVTDASSVVAKTELPVLLDWEHRSEDWDSDTRAAGWGRELQVRDTGVWMRTEFTPDGKADVDGGYYSYLSPVLVIDAESRDVQQIISVALTNKPALRMESIGKFRERFSAHVGPLRADQESSSMDKQKRALLCAAFSLAESASDDEILAAQRAQAAQVVSLSAAKDSAKELFTAQAADLTTARGELESLRTKVTDLTSKLEDATKVSAQVELDREIDALFAENVKKLPPAMAKAQKEFCRKSRTNFDAFKEFTLPNLPELGNAAPASTAPGEKTQAGTTTSALREKPAISEKERLRLRAKGMTDAEIDASLKHLAEQKARIVVADEED